MKTAELMALADAHGIDLTQAARQLTAHRPRPRSRLAAMLERLERCQIPRDVQARGRQTHVVRRAEWSLAELGLAAEGVPLIPWLAALYAYQRDRSCYWPLWRQLSIEALDLCGRQGWKAHVRADPAVTQALLPGGHKFYLLEITALVLDEEANAPLFLEVPKLYAWYMGVESEVWESSLAARFDALKRCFAGWVQTAESAVNARLADAAEDSTPDLSPETYRRIVAMKRA